MQYKYDTRSSSSLKFHMHSASSVMGLVMYAYDESLVLTPVDT